MSFEKCLPIIFSSLAVLILGCVNPRMTQSKMHGTPTGQPSYMWLAVAALLAGLIACYIANPKDMMMS